MYHLNFEFTKFNIDLYLSWVIRSVGEFDFCEWYRLFHPMFSKVGRFRMLVKGILGGWIWRGGRGPFTVYILPSLSDHLDKLQKHSVHIAWTQSSYLRLNHRKHSPATIDFFLHYLVLVSYYQSHNCTSTHTLTQTYTWYTLIHIYYYH